MASRRMWTPAGLLTLGAGLNLFFVSGRVQPAPLRVPLDSLPRVIAGATGTDIPVSEREQEIAGVTSYVLRDYRVDDASAFGVYVGYYDEQRQGKSIHSPRNCLPGAGWEPVGFRAIPLATPQGEVTVNRYHIVREDEQAIVYYWYQGRGRVANNEYAVKIELLRDAALLGRTEEALVRVVVPVAGNDIAAADSVAARVAAGLVPVVSDLLPTR